MNAKPDISPTAAEPDWAMLRSRFPILEKKTYLNNCAYGAMATDVTNALQRYICDRQEKGTDWDYWVERNDSVRNAVAGFLGAGPDEIAVTASASAGINSVASALSLCQSHCRWIYFLECFLTGGSETDINYTGILGRNFAPGQALAFELRHDAADRWLFHDSEFDNAAEVQLAIGPQNRQHTPACEIDTRLAQARANYPVELAGRPIQKIRHKGP